MLGKYFPMDKICQENTKSKDDNTTGLRTMFLLLKSRGIMGLRCSDRRCPVRLQMSPDKNLDV